MSKHHVRRIDQLDAMCFDDELLALLNTHYRKAFSFFSNSFGARFGPELDTLFKFSFKYLPLHILGTSFGQSLFQLQYKHSSTHRRASLQKLQLLAAISVVLPWFWDRLIRKFILSLPNNDFTRKSFDATYLIESKFFDLYKVMNFLNFCIFLQKSSFPTVLERLLCIRPLHSAPQNIRMVQYESVTRELLWHGCAEFLGFILPLINVHRLKGYLRRRWLPWTKSYRSKYFANNTCAICGEIPNFPHTTGCLHVFCYYCIASLLLADPIYFCFDCDTTVQGIDSLKPLALNFNKMI